MTQTPFQGGSFQPIESGNVADNVAGTFGPTNRGWQRTAAMLAQHKEANIRNSGSLWGQLKGLSVNANKLLETKHKDWEITQDAKAREWLHQNPVSKETVDEYRQELRELGYSAIDANKMAAEWEAKGGDIWTSEKFRGLTPHLQVGVVRDYIRRTMGGYNPDADPGIFNATDPTDRNAALSVYRQDFWKHFDGFDEKMVHIETKEKIDTIEATSNKAWNALRTKEIKEQRLKDAEQELITGLKGDNPAEAVMFMVESRLGEFGGVRGQSRQDVIDRVAALVETGELNRDDYLKLKKAKFIARDGTEKVFGEYYKGDFHKVEVARNKHKNEKYKNKKDQITRDKFDWHESSFEELSKMKPEEIDNDHFETLQQESIKRWGVRSDKVEKWRSNYAAEELQYKGDDARLAALQEMNLLSESDLENVGGKLRTKYLQQAKANDQRKQTNGRNIDDIRNMPSLNVEATRDGRRHNTVGRLGDKMVSRYLQLSRELAVAGVENYQEEAFKQVTDWWEKNEKKLKHYKGYKLDLLEKLEGQGKGIAPLADEYKKEIAEFASGITDLKQAALDNQIHENGKPIGATVFFDTAEATSWEVGFGTAGWRVPPKVAYLARHYNVHPLSIMNRQRAALKIEPPLPDDRAELKAFNKLKAEEKKVLLDQNSSPLSRMRTWSQLPGGGIERLEVTGGKEGDIDTASSESGFSKHMIAAAMYWNELNPSGAITEHSERDWLGLNYMIDPSRFNLDKLAFSGFVYPQK